MVKDRESPFLYVQLDFQVLVSTELKCASLDSHLSVILLPFVIIGHKSQVSSGVYKYLKAAVTIPLTIPSRHSSY